MTIENDIAELTSINRSKADQKENFASMFCLYACDKREILYQYLARKKAQKIAAARQSERDREDRTIHKKFLRHSKW